MYLNYIKSKRSPKITKLYMVSSIEIALRAAPTAIEISSRAHMLLVRLDRRERIVNSIALARSQALVSHFSQDAHSLLSAPTFKRVVRLMISAADKPAEANLL